MHQAGANKSPVNFIRGYEDFILINPLFECLTEPQLGSRNERKKREKEKWNLTQPSAKPAAREANNVPPHPFSTHAKLDSQHFAAALFSAVTNAADHR